MMLQQKDILQWLKKFTVSEVKEIVTIKNEQSLDYIKRILTYKPGTLPKDIMQHGISQNTTMDATCLYIRDRCRHKINKASKLKMDALLLQNLTVSRLTPWAMSVKKEFIRSGFLSECMMTLSDSQLFIDKYLCHKRGFSWFNPKSISSFSTWFVFMFERQILEAFHSRANSKELRILGYLQLNFTLEIVREMIRKLITTLVEKTTQRRNNPKKNEEQQEGLIDVTYQEAPYLLQKCLQKIQTEDMEISEAILEYEWSSSDPTLKVHKVMAQLAKKAESSYANYLIDLKAKEIEEMSLSRKKRRKNKNIKENVPSQVQEADQEKTETPAVTPPLSQPLFKKQEAKESNVNHKSLHVELLSRKPERRKPSPPRKDLLSPSKVTDPTEQVPVMSLQTELALSKQQQPPKQETDQHRQQVVLERINQHILTFSCQLREASQAMEKHRRVCIQHIRKKIQELEFKPKWRLQLFGSASIDFALKQSDLDLVLISQERICSLKDLRNLFRGCEWVINCEVIEATKIPIVKFEVVLSQLNYPKQKDNKKQHKGTVSVDLSIWCDQKEHEGLRNTRYLQSLFQEHQYLQPTCLILKQLSRVHELNRPFTGGIGSYVLGIMCHNILISKNDFPLSSNLHQHLYTISLYLVQEFEPFQTIISPNKEASLVKPNPTAAFNIQDPQTKTLLKNDARLIQEIMSLMKQLHLVLINIKTDLLKCNLEERKKMKRVFFEHWNQLFRVNK